jgi:hypothetical protein
MLKTSALITMDWNRKCNPDRALNIPRNSWCRRTSRAPSGEFDEAEDGRGARLERADPSSPLEETGSP